MATYVKTCTLHSVFDDKLYMFDKKNKKNDLRHFFGIKIRYICRYEILGFWTHIFVVFAKKKYSDFSRNSLKTLFRGT